GWEYLGNFVITCKKGRECHIWLYKTEQGEGAFSVFWSDQPRFLNYVPPGLRPSYFRCGTAEDMEHLLQYANWPGVKDVAPTRLADTSGFIIPEGPMYEGWKWLPW